jgi:hypothetical protein
MAAVGKSEAKTGYNEVEADCMSDAPPERTYEEAISPRHREFLAGRGIIVGEAPKK